MEGWRKSSYSDGNGGNCVETASDDGVILVRDTTNRDGGTLAFGAEAWTAFVASLRQWVGTLQELAVSAAHSIPTCPDVP